MKNLHAIFGLVGVVTFLLTGTFMRVYYPGMESLDGGARMLFRSRHLYLLLVSLVNLGIGIYYRPFNGSLRRGLQLIGSGLMLLSPILATAAFFWEAPRADMDRPFTNPALYGIFAGILCHTAGGAGRQDRSPGTP